MHHEYPKEFCLRFAIAELHNMFHPSRCTKTLQTAPFTDFHHFTPPSRLLSSDAGSVTFYLDYLPDLLLPVPIPGDLVVVRSECSTESVESGPKRRAG
jgi:hypothetical protein